jgi:AAA+ superfamily predicted ATPase
MKSNFDRYWAALPQYGQQVMPEFKLTNENTELYEQVLRYFLRDETCGLALSKGLILEGSPGTGKTTVMRIMARMTGLFHVVPCRDIVRDALADKDATGAIDKYTRQSFCMVEVIGIGSIGFHPRQYCFDDLGLEPEESALYGNKFQIMREILLDRYDLAKQKGMITHATTNLTPSQIEEKYDARVRDRFREMFNLIKVYGSSLRK